MTDKIIIYYAPFANESQVWMFKDGKKTCNHVSSSLEDISTYVLNLAYAENTFNVSISAPYAFIAEITKKVQEEELLYHSNNKIIIEGI